MSGAGERERLRAALRELVGERGYVEVTAPDVELRAGLAPGAFDRHFTDLDSCFASLWSELDAEVGRLVAAAFSAPGSWRERIRAALAALLDYLAADGSRARLYVTEVVFVGGPLPSARRAALDRLAGMVDAGRGEAAPGAEPPILIAEAIAGATWQHLNRRVRAGRAAELPDDLAELTYLMVLPYLGPAAAAAELCGPRP